MGALDGRRALVTGAATGIGRATAERLAADGAEVFGLDAAPDFTGIVADVTDPDAMAEAMGAVGDLDICVANAGISLMEPFVDGGPDSWRRVLEVNLIGVMVTFRAAALAMPRGGRLLATSSAAGLHGEPGAAAYCASKAGVIALVRTLAIELGPDITVNAVAPGQIRTAMALRDLDEVSAQVGRPVDELLQDHLDRRVPAGRMGTPEEVASTFAYLASPEAGYITGEVIRVDGGELAS